MHASDDPDHFYDQVIMPYKGLLEEWYVERAGVAMYLTCLLLTAWVVARPHSSAVWRVFRDLPPPPLALRSALGYV